MSAAMTKRWIRSNILAFLLSLGISRRSISALHETEIYRIVKQKLLMISWVDLLKVGCIFFISSVIIIGECKRMFSHGVAIYDI